jgi:hypothetical protein
MEHSRMTSWIVLAVAAALHALHQQVFRGDERQILPARPRHDLVR